MVGAGVIDADWGNDTVIGSAGADSLFGNYGNDSLNGGGGNDLLSGGSGNDIFVAKPGMAADQINDFTRGADKIDVSAFWLSWSQLQPKITASGANSIINFGSGDTITLIGVAAGSLTAADFVLSSGPIPPATLSIAPLSADKVEGNSGGSTDFTFSVNRAGNLATATSVDWQVVAGSADKADFNGNILPSGRLTFNANDSNPQTITVKVAADTIYENNGAPETFSVRLSNPVGATIGTSSADGKIQNDDAAPPPIVIGPTEGNDSLTGTSGNDNLRGLGGNDTLTGLAGDDTLSGEAGNDSLSGGDGNDSVEGGSGADAIYGGNGNDRIWGYAGQAPTQRTAPTGSIAKPATTSRLATTATILSMVAPATTTSTATWATTP